MLADFQVAAEAVGTSVKRFTTIADAGCGVYEEPGKVLIEPVGLDIAEMADCGG